MPLRARRVNDVALLWPRSGWRQLGQRYVSRTTLYSRVVLLATAAICAALVVGTLGEAWVNFQLQQQIAQAQGANGQVRRDMAATSHSIAQAESPSTIEDEARARGYVRPGDHALVVAGGQKGQAAATHRAGHTGARGGVLGGHWLDWWQLFFGG